MAILPISQAGAGNQLAPGKPSVANSALSVLAQGTSTLRIDAPVVAPWSGSMASASSLALGLIANHSQANSTAIRFTFSGAMVQPRITAGEQSLYGAPSVSISALIVKTPSLRLTGDSVNKPLVYAPPQGPLDLLLTESVTTSTAKNIPFNYGPIVAPGISAGRSDIFGIAALESAALSAKPTSIGPRQQTSQHIVTPSSEAGAIVYIDMFIERDLGFSGNFNFGGAAPIVNVGNINSLTLGVPRIGEGAPSLRPAPIGSKFSPGIATLYSKDPRDIQKNYGVTNLDFLTDVNPSDALNIGFYFWKDGQLSPFGFNEGLVGLPHLSYDEFLFAKGFRSPGFGQPTIINTTRFIYNFGGMHFVAGSPSVDLGLRVAMPAGWSSFSISLHNTSHGVRRLATAGLASNAYGAAWVSRSPRSLSPASIHLDRPSNHSVSRKIVIKPQGYEATLWGTRVIPESMTLYPQGFSESFGAAIAYLYTSYIKPRSFLSVGVQPADRWGWHLTYNLTQYINHYLIPDGGLVPPAWSEWQSIENRNKIIGVIGFGSMRNGYTSIENNARLLEAKGSDFNRYGSSMTAYRIRAVLPEPIEHPAMTSWGVVYNAARLISASGLRAGTYGEHKAINTRRNYERVGNFESLAMGLPMVSDRIRTIAIEPRYSIAPPIIRLPTIDLLTKYVSFNGYETAGYGSPSLSVHFNIIAPKWNHREKPGSPALKNLTPEVYIRGHASSDFGMISARTQWRTVEANGDRATLFGLSKVSDTKQFVSVRGTQSIGISQNHKLTKLGSNAYSLQYIWLDDESGYGANHGIGPNATQVPPPGLNQNVLRPKGSVFLAIGVASMWSNNIIIDSGIAIQNVSNNTLVYNGINYIRNAGSIASKTSAGEPSLSPHTIWAVKEAPNQAKVNNPVSGRLHYVGDFDGMGAGARCGHPKVESTIRGLAVRSAVHTSIGRPSLELKRNFITPDSFRLSRFGLPSIPFSTRAIVIADEVAESLFGSAVVEGPPYTGPLYIRVSGMSSGSPGYHVIENFNRRVRVVGYSSLLMGTKKNGDKPYMWQGLRVGEIVPVVAGGYEQLRMGSTTIWHKIRELQPVGLNAFSSGYELSQFRGRMTVSNAMLPEDVVFEIIASGREGSVIGQHGVKLGQHFIRPDGNSEQFRKGAW